MTATYRCDGCRVITDCPTLRIERVDGFGGGGVRINEDRPWDLCAPCSRKLDSALKTLLGGES